MFVVALTRWNQPLESELPALAAALGEQPYDLRMKLVGTLPAYVYRGPDVTRAHHVLGVLQARKHGAVAVDFEHVADAESMVVPRRVRFDLDRLSVEHHAQNTMQSAHLVYAELLAVVHAMQSQATDASHVSTESKVSLGRAALTGGVMWTKSKTTETNTQHTDAEQVLYLFRQSGAEPMLLRQQSIRVEGLGSPARTSLEVFRATIDELRKRAPTALYDNRLLTNKRKAALVSHVAHAKTTTTSHSNASENDLAAHVIALAHLKGQL